VVTYVYECGGCGAKVSYSICCKRKCPKCGKRKLVEIRKDIGE